MIKIVPATSKPDFETIAKLADTIWREHYISMVSLEQIEYMLIKYNSVEALENQYNQGFLFFYITYNDIPVGYVGIKKEIDFLFLSKFYVLCEYRGKKIGKAAMNFVESKAKSYRLKTIRLNVNINNINAIKAYEKMGFKNIGPLVTDIGRGFIMDDYQMEKMMID